MNSSIDYKLLAKQFTELVAAKKSLRIPKLIPNSTLGDALHHLSEAVNVSYETEAIDNIIERLFDEVEHVSSEPHVQEYVLEPIDKMATAFADRINSSFTALSQYHAIVEAVNADAVSRSKQFIDANPFLREAVQAPPNTGISYLKLDWNAGYVLPEFSESEVINRSHQQTGRTESMPSIAIAQILRNDINLRASKEGYINVYLPVETLDAIVARILSRNSTIPENEVRLSVLRLLTMSAFMQHTTYVLTDFFAVEGCNTANACLHSIDLISRLSVLLPLLDDPVIWDVSPDTLTKIQSNMSIYKRFVNLVVYLLTYYRRDRFKDTILLPNSYLNADNYDTFFGREGASTVMLRDYVAVVFPGEVYKNTLRGVLVDEVFDKQEQVTKRIEQGKQSMLTKLTFELNAIKRKTLVLAMLAFSDSAPADLERDPDIDLKRLAEVKAQKVVAGDSDFRVGIYEFLFQAFRVNPFSVILYENIGLRYTQILATSKELDDLTLSSMEISVVAKLIQMFTLQKCCVR
jgi:hypothetical protein